MNVCIIIDTEKQDVKNVGEYIWIGMVIMNNDLIDILEEKLTPSEIVELLKECNFSQDELDEYAIYHFVCPECYGKLVVRRWLEKREYFGCKVNEEIIGLECEECGFIVD